MPYLAVFGLEFENDFIIFEISTLGFVYLQCLLQIKNYLNKGQNMPFLGISEVELEKINVVFEITVIFFQKQNFVQK